LPQKVRKKPPTGQKKCNVCGKTRTLLNFYTSTNPATSSDGKTVDVCKKCIKDKSLNPDGSINIENFKQSLMLMDKPYVPTALDSAINETKIAIETDKGRKDIIGNYMKNVASLPQYAKLSFIQSMQLLDGGILSTTTSKNTTTEKDDKYFRQIDDFIVTDDLLELFGEGYSKKEYQLMKSKYEKLKINYSIQTNLHEEALATYVRFKVKEEQATATGNVTEADKWNKAATDAAEKAKLTPRQLTQADLQGGINSFSEIFKAVEQAVEVIPILPKFKFRPNDALDFNIWCYINYIRDLQGLPQCEYEDIYKFYDKKKEEHLKQYGDPYNIFKNDPNESLRDNIKNFIKLPDEYYDEENDSDGEE